MTPQVPNNSPLVNNETFSQNYGQNYSQNHSPNAGLTTQLPPAFSFVDQARTELKRVLFVDPKSLQEFLPQFCFDGGVGSLDRRIGAEPVFSAAISSDEHFAGYDYRVMGTLAAKLRLGVNAKHQLVYRCTEIKNDQTIDHEVVFSENIETPINVKMDSECPLANIAYQILAAEYPKIKLGNANTEAIYILESFLKQIERLKPGRLSKSARLEDPVLISVRERILKIESDPVLSWHERRGKFLKIWEERATVIQTKSRAHKLFYPQYGIQALLHDFQNLKIRFKMRPISNTIGTFRRFTLDPIKWFLSVVRNNMGYSIAMGIYSPFTFFFITQPMNPHAMWAVGKVRSAYIEASETVGSVLGGAAATGTAVGLPKLPQELPQNSGTNSGSNAGTTAAPITTSEKSPEADRGLLSRVSQALTSAVAGTASSIASVQQQNPGMLLSTDIPKVDGQKWDDRMSNFKDMQIAYEGNLEIASRMGRLEQMETQLNWPLIIEGSWEELERYLTQIKRAKTNPNLDVKVAEFLTREELRVHLIELYIWDKNVRFILDHPYTMMDESKEQTAMDQYVGRAFVQLDAMTQILSQRMQGFKLPSQYQKIADLARRYKSTYRTGGDLFERLKNNSALFQQKDRFATKELRSNMRRQWEILYLLQNKAQEGANMGLQTYIWSIRNAVWVLQSVYSAKREELTLLTEGSTDRASFAKTDSQLEALYHMMVLEFTSIKTEIGDRLTTDIEAIQRRSVIDAVEASLKDRTDLLKSKNLI